MPRSYTLYMKDIFISAQKIMEYTRDFTYEKFIQDQLVQDAVIRNLEIIGEAARNIPDEIKMRHTGIEWQKILGIRNIIAHAYFRIDLQIFWDIIQSDVPGLKEAIKGVLEEESE